MCTRLKTTRRSLHGGSAVFAIVAGALIAGTAPAAFAQDPPATPTPPATTPVAPATLPPVTIQLSEIPQHPNFLEFAKSLPQGAIQIYPLTLQANMAAPPPESALVARIRVAYQQLAQSRPDNEPRWLYGLNPMVWIARGKGGLAEWWKEYKKLPYAQRPLSEMFPVAYDFSTNAPSVNRVNSRKLMNQAIDTLMLEGDARKASEIAGRAVTADPTNALALYNSGVLHMALNNYEAAIRMFNRVKDTQASPIIQSRSADYLEKMRKQFVLLLNSKGSQRRIYTDHLDAAWAMANADQPYAAVVFAGQAATYDPEEERPDAHIVVAMVCAKQNRPKDVVRWLQYSLERARGSSSRVVRTLLQEVQAMPEITGAGGTPATTPPATTPPTTPATDPPATNP
jgi:tetratricopeptide (TPR) repeat protein